MRETKFIFIVKDNGGNICLSSEYAWTPEDGLPCEEAILEDMEECTCTLTESVNHCEGGCIAFDEGKVIDKIEYAGSTDKKGKDIYEGYIVDIDDGDGDFVGRGVVVFRNGKFQIDDGSNGVISDIDGRIETIVGNIWENQELLRT